MANLKTKVTELVTGLGMLGFDSAGEALAARPSAMVSVSPELWDQLLEAYSGGSLAEEFSAAFANGQAFLSANDGLRGRLPQIIEWKGAHSNPGEGALPIDLRIDHVYLVSCKYLSKVLHNPSPKRLFDEALRAAVGREASPNWYSELAPAEHRKLYLETVAVCDVAGLPSEPDALSTADKRRLVEAYPPRWPETVDSAYRVLCAKVAEESVRRWDARLRTRAEQETMLWRLLRFGPAPYFVLGAAKKNPLRLRIATPWDWRQRHELKDFRVEPKVGGQPMVAWSAEVRNRHTGATSAIRGHVEVRWSHSRFMNPPEAKVYLDTEHTAVPGYFELQ